MAAGTLAAPMAGSSLRFVPDTSSLHLSGGPSRSASNLSFSARPSATCINASLHAVAEPAPVLDTTMRRPASLYEVLRVNRNASPTEIKSAYRTLAKVYHPDAASDFKEDGRDFIEIHKAYATLSDPAARALYDMSLGRRPFGYSSAVGNRNGYYPTRRWETDQCW